MNGTHRRVRCESERTRDLLASRERLVNDEPRDLRRRRKLDPGGRDGSLDPRTPLVCVTKRGRGYASRSEGVEFFSAL